jgi:hypothetical protein
MVLVNQKERYRRQAALCYEIATTLIDEKAASMIRLGDAYAALAADPERSLPNIFAPATKNIDPRCELCGQKMKMTHSLPSTKIMPAMEAFRCDTCGETLIWKGDVSSPSVAPDAADGILPRLGDRWITRYVAVSFRKTDSDFAPGPVVECPDAELAIQRAGLMVKQEQRVGSVAFSRRMDSLTGEFEPAVILRTFGAIPEDFDIA